MRVLVTGSDGYIGARLVHYLTQRGVTVTGLDTGFYRDGWLYSNNPQSPVVPRTINKDLRHVTAEDLAGQDAIVHLAELSNDPLGQNDPSVTERINFQGTMGLADNARRAGIRRFVYASSCSVYGMAMQDWVDETSPVNPQTAYARCKAQVEAALSPQSNEDFACTFLRNATAYGASPRMRFDIVLNDLCALAWTTRQIKMTSDGSPWRPIVHIDDICEAIACVLAAEPRRVSGQILNVGGTDENYRVRDIARIVSEVFPGCTVTVGANAGDNRSYRVNFSKIREVLPEYRKRWTARMGAEQLLEVFSRIQMSPETYQFRAFTRLKQLMYLKNTHQVDDDLYWKC